MRVVFVALLVGALVPAALGAARPRVRLAVTSPARVTGSGFKAHERVTVTLRAGSLHLRKTVRAGVHGGFSATFAKRAVRTCLAVTITARGARGDHATWHRSVPKSCTVPAAKLVLASIDPLTITGTQFPRRATVSVTVVVGGKTLEQDVTSTAAGEFTAAWPAAATGGCRPSSVVAVAGSVRITWRSPVLAACVVAPIH